MGGNHEDLKRQVRTLIVENLMLQIGPDDIRDDQPLFGPGGLGLDSVDVLQLVVALEKGFGLKISDADAARSILQNVVTVAAAIERHLASAVGPLPTSGPAVAS